jgi:O-antigen/teichoic acid export membrane protein
MSLRQVTIAGLGWSGVARAGQQALDLGFLVCLARLLRPDDFGLVAIVLMFAQFAQLFADLGFGAAVVHHRGLEPRHLSSVFWLNVAGGALLAAIMAAGSPFLASWYGDPRLLGLGVATSSSFLLASVAVVQQSWLNRAMRFREVATIEVGAVMVAGFASVAAALAGWGVWSLVIRLLVFLATRAALLWTVSDWQPEFSFEVRSLRDLAWFSGNLLGFNVVNYWIRNFDYLLISKVVGSAGLGVYSWAYRIMLLPTAQVTQVVQQVMFPALSQIQDDRGRVKRVYLDMAGVVGLTTIPFAAGVFVVARRLILVALGTRWSEVAPILQILCFVAIKQPVGSITGVLFQSQGRTDLMLRWGLLAGACNITGFLVGIRWGITGVAVAYAVVSYLLWYPSIVIPGKLVDLGFGELLRSLSGIFVCSVLMALGMWFVGVLVPQQWGDAGGLGLQVACGVTVYGVLVHGFRLRPYVRAREVLTPRWRADGDAERVHAAGGEG